MPVNGRNFEYLSGEDPYLGLVLVKPAVDGIQSQRVMANAKHYVQNNQETNRGSVSENVDERTQFEIYYPPFEVRALSRAAISWLYLSLRAWVDHFQRCVVLCVVSELCVVSCVLRCELCVVSAFFSCWSCWPHWC